MNANWNGYHDAASAPFASTSCRACSIVTDESDARAAATCEATRWSRMTPFMNRKHLRASSFVAT
jgi:hypothetical protein